MKIAYEIIRYGEDQKVNYGLYRKCKGEFYKTKAWFSQFCCQRLQDENTHWEEYYNPTKGDQKYEPFMFSFNDGMYEIPILFCPFCGEKVELIQTTDTESYLPNQEEIERKRKQLAALKQELGE